MYKIIKDKNDIIQDSIDNVVIDPELKEHLNGVGSLTYSIPYNDQYYEDYIELKTKIKVFGENEDHPEFTGRLLSKRKTFDGNIKLTFEGELAFLNDIQFPPYEFKGSPEELFEDVLNYYNSKCSEDKKILKGIVTVQDDNDYITRSNQDYSSCWSVISEKLVKLLGGYIKLRYVNGVRYLDYLINSGNIATQKIEFGKNLLDLESYIDATSVKTVIIPLGAKNESEERITIESVNENKNYLESSLVSMYGRIENVVIWDDVTIPANLKTKALKELNQMVLANKQITVKAIDLHFTSEEIHSFKIGDIIHCISKPHDIDIEMVLSERTRKLNDPSQDEITLGTKSERFTSSVNDVNKKVEETESKITGNWLQSVIEENTKILLGGNGGYIYVHYADENKKNPDALYVMDSSSLSEAKNVILVNKNGIGFSNNGINGPFVSAWTIDGKFNTDFIQANTITVNHLASNVGEKLDLSSNESIKSIVKKIQTQIEEIDTSLYSVTIQNNTTELYKSTDTVTLSCVVLNKNVDVTEEQLALQFQWYKNDVKFKTGKTITLTTDDIDVRANMRCDFTLGDVTLSSQTLTITDNNDIANLSNSYLDVSGANSVQQLKDGVYFPDYTVTPIHITPCVIDGVLNIDLNECEITYKRLINGVETELNGEKVENGILTIDKNMMDKDDPSLSYVCEIFYKNARIKRHQVIVLNVIGTDGEDAILLYINSSNGVTFKNSKSATTLTVEIMVAGYSIDSSEKMYEYFGDKSKLKWKIKNLGDSDYSYVPDDDPRLSDNGFIFTLNANDIKTKAVLDCELDF